MEENSVKKRGWVKNAAIIFLSVMLVLTFFSRTIMNHSLPEVATASVTSGSINARIRGTGSVTAGDSYEVVVNQTRKVETVYVKVGDKVETGDVLFVLSDADSSELKEAQELLESLQLSYQRALLDLTDRDYAREDRDIQKARDAMAKANAAMLANTYTPDEITASAAAIREAERNQADLETALAEAEKSVAQYEESVGTLEDQLKTLNSEMDKLSKTIDDEDEQLEALKRGNSNPEERLKEAQKELKEAEVAYGQLRITYGAAYDSLYEKARSIVGSVSELDIIRQMEALVSSTSTEEGYFATEEEKEAFRLFSKAQEAIDAARAKVEQLQKIIAENTSVQEQITALNKSIEEHEDELKDKSLQAREINRQLATATQNLTGAQQWRDSMKGRAAAQAELISQLKDADNALQQRKADYDAAEEEYERLKTSLEDLLFALAEQKKNDDKSIARENLDLQDQRKKIARQEELVASLQTDSVGREVTAKVSGVISALNVTAGRDAAANETLAVIELVDRGYNVRINVTNEQAQKVRVGDSAEVVNYYWGPEIKATLTSIVNDPQSQGKSKILVFNISGDVSTGQNLTLSIGQKSANYDSIIPTSAVRSDTNGSFVLVLTAKNTPLGNRYTATRVDVNVLAQDDTQSAVSGLSYGDFVITTSSKPVDAGMQVNLVENP